MYPPRESFTDDRSDRWEEDMKNTRRVWQLNREIEPRVLFSFRSMLALLVGIVTVMIVEFIATRGGISRLVANRLDFVALLGTLIACLYFFSQYRSIVAAANQAPPTDLGTQAANIDINTKKGLLLAATPTCRGAACCDAGLTFRDGRCVR